MITMHDLEEAIAECQGQPNPNANTCIKLAAYYIIKNEMTGMDNFPSLSFSSGTKNNDIQIQGETEFLKKINGKPMNNILLIFDEIMTTIQVVNPRLYEAAMRKL